MADPVPFMREADWSFLRGCPRPLFYPNGRRTGVSGTRRRTADTAAKLQRLGLVRIVLVETWANNGPADKLAQVTLTDAGRAALAAAG